MVIALDFDGTIVEHKYPEIGEEIPFATETIRMLIAERHKVILWSVREGKLLDDAVNWCRERGIEFYAVNRDYPDATKENGEEKGEEEKEETKENNNHFSRKLKADIFIDDRNLGGLPDWGLIYQMVHNNMTWHDVIRNARPTLNSQEPPKRKKKWGLF